MMRKTNEPLTVEDLKNLTEDELKFAALRELGATSVPQLSGMNEETNTGIIALQMENVGIEPAWNHARYFIDSGACEKVLVIAFSFTDELREMVDSDLEKRIVLRTVRDAIVEKEAEKMYRAIWGKPMM